MLQNLGTMKQDLFRNYFRNPNKKFIDSGVICPDCPECGDGGKKWKIDDDDVVITDGTDTDTLVDLGDIESPVDDAETNTTTVVPGGTTTIDGMTKDPQDKDIYFSLVPDFGNTPDDLKVGGIPYNTDISFDFTLPNHDTPDRLVFEADPDRRYPIIDQINDYFKCIGVPVYAAIESAVLDEEACAAGPVSDMKRCMEYIKRKKKVASGDGTDEPEALPYLVFRSTVPGYDFNIDNIVIRQHFLSEEYPTSPYLKEEIDPEGTTSTDVPYNLIFDTVHVDTLDEEERNRIYTLPAAYKIKVDPETGEYISKTVYTDKLTWSSEYKDILLSNVPCLSTSAFKYDQEKAVSYTVKIIYPNTVDAGSQYIWLRHLPDTAEMKRLHEAYNEEKEKDRPAVSELHWYNEWVKETIEQGYWTPVNTLYIVLGTKEKMINPIIIKNPNSFNIKVEVAKHI